MIINVEKNSTTATTVNGLLLDIFAKGSSSTYQLKTITIQVDQLTLRSEYTKIVSDHSISIDDVEELEWYRIVNAPHVRHGLRHLAAKARRQAATGEIEEGGFAVE